MLTNLLRDFPFEITNKQDTLTVNFSNLNKFSWKRKPAKLSNFNHLIKENSFFNLDQQELNLSADLASSEFLKIHDLLGNILSALYMENPEELELWGQTRNTNPSGFNEADESISWDLLKDVYDDDLIVKEKKPLILDLEKSYENQLVSVGPKRRSVVDGASQIASMNLGFNHIRKNPMFLRDEMLDPNLNIEEWDVYKAFCNLLKEESRLDHVYIVNSGAEAVEGALKLAYYYHKGSRDFVLHSNISFHGKSIATGSLAGNYPENDGFQMLPNTMSFSYNNIDSIKDKVNFLRKDGHCNIYAIIVEPYSASMFTGCDEEFLLALRKICDDENIILIFDEVYTGWGKTGSLFYFMRYNNLFPDILTMSKSFGGGKASISAYVTRDIIFNKTYASTQAAPKHSSTYSGFGEEAITAIEAIRIVIEDNYSENANLINNLLMEGLDKLKGKYPQIIKEIRGVGALNCIIIGFPFKLLENLLSFINISSINDKTALFEKVAAGSIMEELFTEHDILITLGGREFVSKDQQNNNNLNSFTCLAVKPSCIAKEVQIERFLHSFDKVLSKGMSSLIKNFINNNIKRIFS